MIGPVRERIGSELPFWNLSAFAVAKRERSDSSGRGAEAMRRVLALNGLDPEAGQPVGQPSAWFRQAR